MDYLPYKMYHTSLYYPNSLLSILIQTILLMNYDAQYFQNLTYPYYPAYTMGRYHFVITGDNPVKASPQHQ